MNHKCLLAIAVGIIFLIIKCGSNTQSHNEEKETNPVKDTMATDKGVGKFKEVQLSHPLIESDVAEGQSIYSSKCFACHKLTDEKLVGPGWKGVTNRRTPEWIMNFITNTNVMLDSDLVAQQLMVICVSRMPNQQLTDDDARDVLEFMRAIDGKN